jgi:hypothetical protein
VAVELQRFLILDIASQQEVGRYDDPARAWHDIRSAVEAQPVPSPGSSVLRGSLPEYTVIKIYTIDARTFPLKLLPKPEPESLTASRPEPQEFRRLRPFVRVHSTRGASSHDNTVHTAPVEGKTVELGPATYSGAERFWDALRAVEDNEIHDPSAPAQAGAEAKELRERMEGFFKRHVLPRKKTK